MSSRATIVLRGPDDRKKASRWAMNIPLGSRIDFKAPTRSLDQNALMWARLTAISNHVDWYGEKLSTEDWKTVFTASLRKARVVPGIDGTGFVVLGLRTSDMTKDEFTSLLDLIDAFAAERGVVFEGESEA